MRLLDVRVVIAILTIWNVLVALSMVILGFTDSTFFSFGPNDNVMFFRMHVDTWGKWFFVVTYTVINQMLQSYGLETITPWMMTKVQNANVSTKDLDVSPQTTYYILIAWTFYLWLGRVFGIQLLSSQIDFLIVVLMSDIVAIVVTTRLYLVEKNKKSILVY